MVAGTKHQRGQLFQDVSWTLKASRWRARMITYHNIGIYNRKYQPDDGMRTENPEQTEGTGRVIAPRLTKKALSSWRRRTYGIYQIEITGPDGFHVYSGKKNIGHPDDPGSQNVLNVDLSTGVPRARWNPAPEAIWLAARKTKTRLN